MIEAVLSNSSFTFKYSEDIRKSHLRTRQIYYFNISAFYMGKIEGGCAIIYNITYLII